MIKQKQSGGGVYFTRYNGLFLSYSLLKRCKFSKCCILGNSGSALLFIGFSIFSLHAESPVNTGIFLDKQQNLW